MKLQNIIIYKIIVIWLFTLINRKELFAQNAIRIPITTNTLAFECLKLHINDPNYWKRGQSIFVFLDDDLKIDTSLLKTLNHDFHFLKKGLPYQKQDNLLTTKSLQKSKQKGITISTPFIYQDTLLIALINVFTLCNAPIHYPYFWDNWFRSNQQPTILSSYEWEGRATLSWDCEEKKYYIIKYERNEFPLSRQ